MRAKVKILVVDDDERIRFVMRSVLKRLENGYTITTARDGREALKKAQVNSCDLLITDLRMADMGGIELTQRLKELNPDLRVLWMTAFGCHTVREQAVTLDVYRCLDKPVEIDEIRKVVLEALENVNHD